MTSRFTLLALGAALTLSACNDGSHTIVQQGPPDPFANELANAAPVELPPAISASKSYRCSPDNSVIYIDWLSNGKARVKKTATEVPGTDVPEGALVGDAKAATIKYQGKSCKG
jgi:hypothetical protein